MKNWASTTKYGQLNKDNTVISSFGLLVRESSCQMLGVNEWLFMNMESINSHSIFSTSSSSGIIPHILRLYKPCLYISRPFPVIVCWGIVFIPRDSSACDIGQSSECYTRMKKHQSKLLVRVCDLDVRCNESTDRTPECVKYRPLPLATLPYIHTLPIYMQQPERNRGAWLPVRCSWRSFRSHVWLWGRYSSNSDSIQDAGHALLVMDESSPLQSP